MRSFPFSNVHAIRFAGFGDKVGIGEATLLPMYCLRKDCLTSKQGVLFADDLYEHALFASAIELAVKDLFPGAKIKRSLGDGADYLTSHDLAFQVGVAIILAGTIMSVVVDWFMGGKLLKPILVVLVES